MIEIFLPLLLVLVFSMLGVLLGTITGLVPGFHPNNVAFILLSFSPVILTKLHFLTAFVPPENLLVLVASTILAASMAHTFLSFIPAAFIGAPEGDTALCLLPAHRLLLEGRAYEATVLSAIGSFGAVIFSFLFLIPFYFAFSSFQFYEIIQSHMLYILIGISTLLILTESFNERMEVYQAILLSSSVFLLSGLFGYVVLKMPVYSPFFFRSTMLFPALTGLFGLSTILFSLLYTPEIPEQRIEEPEMERGEIAKSVISGSAFGSLVSFLPGITSAHATVMALLARRNRNPEDVITTLSSVNTANVIFCLATLFLIFRARSGATIAISNLLQVQPWEKVVPSSTLIYLLIAVLIGAAFSFFITKYVGKQFSRLFVKIPYREMLISIAVFLSVLVLLFTGALGLLILLVAACIGLIPVYFGVRRSNCMGVLLLPIIIWLWQA
ncbi:MAG: tripartite tricarboxylate transporter permease [Methanophagales archaeon]|nr:tripartite tricarboxylate transporter permease [Methanophagales archaeon]MCW3141340.1 tripartite tricarboxylate transporter permease [Methanophagales archaeon]